MNVHNPVVVAAFHTALIHQAIIALLTFLVLAAFWATSRVWRPARVRAEQTAWKSGGLPEPGPGSAATRASFAVLFANTTRQLLTLR
ncbi:MAG TPA: hypothetical protein VFQ44_00185 [Streptosporangiaceae bacterium]|nr:hypothetical protein [Streptosporangiaceae bacterium]